MKLALLWLDDPKSTIFTMKGGPQCHVICFDYDNCLTGKSFLVHKPGQNNADNVFQTNIGSIKGRHWMLMIPVCTREASAHLSSTSKDTLYGWIRCQECIARCRYVTSWHENVLGTWRATQVMFVHLFWYIWVFLSNRILLKTQLSNWFLRGILPRHKHDHNNIQINTDKNAWRNTALGPEWHSTQFPKAS